MIYEHNLMYTASFVALHDTFQWDGLNRWEPYLLTLQ